MAGNNIRYAIEKARDGNDTLVVFDGMRRIPVHSAYRPCEEGAAFQTSFKPEKFDTLIVLGLGLGYHLSGLSQCADSYRRIVLIDHLAELEKEIAQNPHTSFLTKASSVVCITGQSVTDIENALAPLIDLASAKGIQVLEHPASVRAFPEYYRAVKSAIEKIINRGAANLITRSAFSKRFFINAVVNLGRIDGLFPFMHLRNAFSGPALVLAAGPSLAHNIAKLTKHAAHIITIAVDSALPVLRGHGIVPDFFVSIDPQPLVIEHLSARHGQSIPLVTLTSHPSACSSPCFLGLNSHPVAQFLQEAIPFDIGSFHSATGSVAGDALMAALEMGFTKIGLLGFDSAFLRYEAYARGSAYQRRWGLYSQNRFSTVETKNCDYIFHASGSLRHAGLYTRKSFMSYRDAVDDMIAQKGNNTVVMISPLGVLLAHAQCASFEEFLRDAAGTARDNKRIVNTCRQNARPFAEAAPLSSIISVLTDEVIAKIAEASFPSNGNKIGGAIRFFKGQNYLNC
jgi:hypothetical protein